MQNRKAVKTAVVVIWTLLVASCVVYHRVDVRVDARDDFDINTWVDDLVITSDIEVPIENP